MNAEIRSFKAGDKVRFVAEYDNRFHKGRVCTVNRVDEFGRLILNEDATGDAWGPDYFEKATASAISPTYESLGAEIGKLVQEKNAAYGSSFQKAGDIMRILYPDGIPLDKMDDALAVVRVIDKLFRLATDKDAFGESPWRDVAGYALLGAKRAQTSK